MAEYNDGTRLYECSGDGSQHRVGADIEMSRVSSMCWLPNYTEYPRASVRVTPDSRPRLFRRRLRVLDGSGGQPTVHGLCLENEQNGKGAYLFLHENGELVLANDLQADGWSPDQAR
jgi:hypothetical protein